MPSDIVILIAMSHHQSDLCLYLQNRKKIHCTDTAEHDFIQALCNLVAGVSSQYHHHRHGVLMDCFSEYKGEPCPGQIHVEIDGKTGNIVWGCDCCFEKGCITNWDRSFYNCINVKQDIKH